MRKICPNCKSHDVRITETEVICNICDTTTDYLVDGSWAFDSQPCNLKAEARMYNSQYHRATTNLGPRAKGAQL